MQRILIIYGPTASGKSARAMARARAENGVIINADAMQVYRELRILTARPGEAEEAETPHRLYGFLPASTACSAGIWLAEAKTAVEEAWAQGRLPIVTGGTGLYLKALMEGLSPIPEIPEEVRERVRGGGILESWNSGILESSSDGIKGCSDSMIPEFQDSTIPLHSLLTTRDPQMAARLKPGDTQRILRALEVLEATGKSLAWWQNQPREKIFPDAEFTVEMIELPRAELYARCDARFLKMLEEGAMEEVRALLALGLPRSLPALRAVGVPELSAYITDEVSLEDAIRKAQQATRNYAKRQMTWGRGQIKNMQAPERI